VHRREIGVRWSLAHRPRRKAGTTSVKTEHGPKNDAARSLRGPRRHHDRNPSACNTNQPDRQLARGCAPMLGTCQEHAGACRMLLFANQKPSAFHVLPRPFHHPIHFPGRRIGDARTGSSPFFRHDGHARAMIVGTLVYPVAGYAGRSSSNSAQRYHGDGLKLLAHP
jgi:hypothetical protein